LERLLKLMKEAPARPATGPGTPWELGVAPDVGREQTAADLEAYLAAGIPPRGVSWRINMPKGFEGTVPVSVTAGGQDLTARVVIGTKSAPSPATVTGRGVVKELRIVYPRGERAPFWRPLGFIGGKVGAWDIGWVWLYVVAYLPVLLALRWLLRVA
jgi:hypothetical protein